MELYSENENYKLYHGNMLDMLSVIEPNSVDSIVTDPPYEMDKKFSDESMFENNTATFGKITNAVALTDDILLEFSILYKEPSATNPEDYTYKDADYKEYHLLSDICLQLHIRD